MDATPATDTAAARHPIQVVARRTGLSVDVIRVWERRYGAVQPGRVGGRRLYSDADIERLLRLRQVTQAGRRIGDIARLPDAELAALVEEDRAARAAAGVGGPASPSLDGLYAGCLDAVQRMDQRALEAALGRAAADLPLPVLLEELIAPLLGEIGDRWCSGDLRVCHEHAASSVIRTFLGGLRSTVKMGEGGPVLLVATPAGQNHEFGALMVDIVAAAEGWSSVYLGPNAPAAELAAAARQTDARALALSITYPPDDPVLREELRRLRQLLPEMTLMIVGGRAAAAYRDVVEEIGAELVDSAAALRTTLDRLRA